MKYLMLFVLVIAGCKAKQSANTVHLDVVLDFSKGPPTMVYKMKKDYSKLVPVILSDDKTRIVGYPGVGDINLENGVPLPTPLHDGYYLDNRGITNNTAFLKLTYAEYAALESTPTLDTMYSWIIDANPLTELCNCGSRKAFTDIENQLNGLIKTSKLRTVCKVVR